MHPATHLYSLRLEEASAPAAQRLEPAALPPQLEELLALLRRHAASAPEAAPPDAHEEPASELRAHPAPAPGRHCVNPGFCPCATHVHVRRRGFLTWGAHGVRPRNFARALLIEVEEGGAGRGGEAGEEGASSGEEEPAGEEAAGREEAQEVQEEALSPEDRAARKQRRNYRKAMARKLGKLFRGEKLLARAEAADRAAAARLAWGEGTRAGGSLCW